MLVNLQFNFSISCSDKYYTIIRNSKIDDVVKAVTVIYTIEWVGIPLMIE